MARYHVHAKHIAHGYFELDDAYVLSVIQNDLKPLAEAIEYLIRETETAKIEKEVDEATSAVR